MNSFPDPCADVVSDCPHWKDYCHDHPKVREICGKTCNVCYEEGKNYNSNYDYLNNLSLFLRIILILEFHLFYLKDFHNNYVGLSNNIQQNLQEYSKSDIYDTTPYQDSQSYSLNQEPVDSHLNTVQEYLPKPGQRNRRQRYHRRFFNTGAFFNKTRAFKSKLRSAVGKLLGPQFIFDGFIGVSALPPIVVLPLALLAFGLLFRDEIGNIITDKFCKLILVL